MYSLFTCVLIGFGQPRLMPDPWEVDDPLLGKGPWLSAKEQRRILSLWPEGVDKIRNLKFYKPTQYSQRISITNGADLILPVHRSRDDELWGLNPNRADNPKWAVPGGLFGLKGWTSYVGVALPPGAKIKAWTGRVVTPQSGSGGLAKRLWEFPDGTTFVDLLARDGDILEVFELRVRRKHTERWVSSVPFRGAGIPSGYRGPGRSCASCHDDPGDAYGISRRGGGTIISAPILKEGTVDWDTDHWPLSIK